jgi:hypothetical protein
MTTEASAVEGTEGAADQAALSSQDDRDYEAEARKMGWVPEDEFKGDKKPARFKTAQEFVEDGETLTPHVKRIIANIEKDFAERLTRIEKSHKSTVGKLEEIHKAEVASLKQQKTAAVKAGNVELVAEIDDELDKRRDGAPLQAEEVEDQTALEDAFAKENDWYGKNIKMTAFAQGISLDLAKKSPDMKLSTNLKKVVEAVEEQFPEYFEKKPAANGHAAVDGGSDAPGPRGDPLSKLPPEARAQAKADMKAYPKIYPDAQSWLKAYNG